MKLTWLLLLFFNPFVVFSQRYLTDDYPLLDSIIGGIYGTSVDYQSNNQDLLFDFYEPANDTVAKRPLIIYIHGGGFTSGSRSYPSIKLLCRRMANKGYAVASLDYRLDPNFELYNSISDRRAMTDAMHDAKQAIRYFKANASAYQIDTSLVFIGGESAGAATSMMASFVDKQSEMSVYPMANPNNPIGSIANANYSNSVKGTLCLCGLILDTLAIELPSDPTILWTHGTNDNFIPIALAFNIVLRAANIGLPITTKVYEGATHCPWYYGNPNWSTYLDSTITDITNFIYPLVSAPISADVNQIIDDSNFTIYPNPFRNEVYLELKTSNPLNSNTTMKIYTLLGDLVLEKNLDNLETEKLLILDGIENGIYFLVLAQGEESWTKKIVKGN